MTNPKILVTSAAGNAGMPTTLQILEKAMKALIGFSKGLMSMPMPWQTWLGLLVAVNAAGPIYFFEALEAKIVLGAFLASVAFMTAIFASKGFVRLLGLGHIFWVPMVPWLWARLDQVGPGDLLGYWMITVMAVNSLSLIIDAIDVFRYVRGEREPYIAGHRMSGAHRGGEHHHSPLVTSAHATFHCLIGCIIGEAAGLAIGVSLGWGAVETIALAVVLAYVSGFAMALVPVMKQAGLGLAAAMRVIWLGEAISIAMMEIAMNVVDYWVGGIQTASIWSALFWLGLAAAAPAGFLAAWPVNHLLLKHELKAGH